MITSLTIIKDDMVRKNNYEIVKILEKIMIDWDRLEKRIENAEKLADNMVRTQNDIKTSFNKLSKSLNKVKSLDLEIKESND